MKFPLDMQEVIDISISDDRRMKIDLAGTYDSDNNGVCKFRVFNVDKISFISFFTKQMRGMGFEPKNLCRNGS